MMKGRLATGNLPEHRVDLQKQFTKRLEEMKLKGNEWTGCHNPGFLYSTL